MRWHLAAYLVKLSRFGLLLGLALWLGAAVAMLLSTPAVWKRLGRAEAGELAGAMLRRVDWLLLACIVLVGASLGFRVFRDGTMPPVSIVGPVAAMAASRLVLAFALGPALRSRLRGVDALATDGERAVFDRLRGVSMTLMTLEVCLGAWALFSVS